MKCFNLNAGVDFYAVSQTRARAIHEAGQEFITHEGKLPEGFCSGAWVAIYPHIRLLMMGGNMPGTEPGIALGSCNDGLRPVIFKIERI